MDWVICLSVVGMLLFVAIFVLWATSKRKRQSKRAIPASSTSESRISQVVWLHAIMRQVSRGEGYHWNPLDHSGMLYANDGKSIEQMEREVSDWLNDLRRRGKKLVSEAGEYFVVDKDKQPPYF